MKLLIDTNIILDMVFKRSGCNNSMNLFRKMAETGACGFITASAVTDLFYIIRKETHDTDQTYCILENIFQLVSVISVTEQDIQDAFMQKWRDFEDCVQYITGKNNRVDYIITANCKDYSESTLPVMTPIAWIAMNNSEQINR